MTRLALALLLAAAGSALGQYPGAGGSPQPPTFGNRQQQSPLSPYLNLLNGSGANPAANYYNLTRPFLQQQGQSPFAPQVGQNAGGFQQQIGYLPPAAPPDYSTRDPFDATGSSALPPTGHPVVYGNKYGQASGAGRSGFFPPSGSQQQPAGGAKAIPRAKK